ncbi:MAG: glycine betaine ABC transporter substrate-binding protein [Phycisphaerae bacterium]
MKRRDITAATRASTWLLVLPLLATFSLTSPAWSQDAPADARDAREARIVVASKQFTESIVLGEALTRLAEAAGYRAEHATALGGSGLVLSALRDGRIDAYVEYTGTLLQEHYADRNFRFLHELRDALAEDGLAMSPPLGFNNGYAIGMKRERAAELGITTMSDLADHPQLRLVFNQEFLERGDGWPAIVSFYSLPAFASVGATEHQIALRAVDQGQADATELYTTDAEIPYYDFVALEDDLGFFPRYDAVILYRRDLADRAPAALEAMLLLAGTLDADAMQQFNAMVTIDKAEADEAAAALLEATVGEQRLARLAETPAEARSTGRRSVVAAVWETTLEHLAMVLVAVSAGIAVAVPLGIFAAKDASVGRLVLPAVGVLQTIPSLALLVFMIPLLGLGFWPAAVALFLYSLLPIVRNTQQAIADLPPATEESAEALGLSPGRRLWLVELPLALPAILAGIKTSTVITIGFATLGAFINAGGYGQPILAGLRRDEMSLILQGAIPAAVMAVVAQVLLELLGRAVIPRGLRLKRAA